MILLDPDLELESPHGPRPVRGDPDPAPKATSAQRAAAPATKGSRNSSLPSARTLGRFLSEAQAAVRLKGEVTVLLTTDAAIRKLNRQFRGKNKVTDVLSFPAEGVGAEGLAGDLAISVPTALRQGTACGHSLRTELEVLMLHGLLQGLIERANAPKARASKSPGKHPSGAKARTVLAPSAARLKSSPDTRLGIPISGKASKPPAKAKRT